MLTITNVVSTMKHIKYSPAPVIIPSSGIQFTGRAFMGTPTASAIKSFGAFWILHLTHNPDDHLASSGRENQRMSMRISIERETDRQTDCER